MRKHYINLLLFFVYGLCLSVATASEDYSHSWARWTNWNNKICHGIKIKNNTDKSLKCSVGFIFTSGISTPMTSGEDFTLQSGESRNTGVCNGVVTSYEIDCK